MPFLTPLLSPVDRDRSQDGLTNGCEDPCHDEMRDIPGIVIRDWAPRPGQGRIDPRVPAIVYGETFPVLPTLPFGRWKTVA